MQRYFVVRSLRYLQKKRYQENVFNANLSRPGETKRFENRTKDRTFVICVARPT